MDLLPNLEIEEDIKNLQDCDDDDLTMEEMEGKTETLPEDLKRPEENKDLANGDIFIEKPTTKNTIPINDEMEFDEETKRLTEKPKKKKRPISDKQKAHLDRIRAKAIETKKLKAQAKKNAIKEVKQKFKKTPKTELDEQFEEKMKIEKQERIKQEEYNERNSFMNFMSNMKKFEEMKTAYEITEKRQKPREPKQMKTIKEEVKPKKPLVPPTIQNDPYDDWF